jgi:hypothetical protein
MYRKLTSSTLATIVILASATPPTILGVILSPAPTSTSKIKNGIASEVISTSVASPIWSPSTSPSRHGCSVTMITN